VSSLISATPRSTIQALLMLAAYQTYAPYTAGSINPSVDRWDMCFDYLDQSLPWIASKFFVDVAYNDEVKKNFATMADELKESFSERAENYDWIAAETKKKIQEKIKEITPKVGYPEHVSDSSRCHSNMHWFFQNT
jgi:predicted metalloendopeptidase